MTEESREMPQVPFGKHQISRLIVGGNQQQGSSHTFVSHALGYHMVEYFTVDRIVEYVKLPGAGHKHVGPECDALWGGRCRDALLKLREEGDDINTIVDSGMLSLADPSEEYFYNMMQAPEAAWDQMLEEFKPIGVYLGGMATDYMWRVGKIDKVRDFLARGRDAGVQVGVATHIPEAIEYIEEKGFDIDFYLASLYRWQKSHDEILKIMPEVPIDGMYGAEIYLPSELPRMLETISKTSKTCVTFKLFAGGRVCNSPQEISDVYVNVLGSIKPEDPVLVGMYPRFVPNMIEENADLVKKYG